MSPRITPKRIRKFPTINWANLVTIAALLSGVYGVFLAIEGRFSFACTAIAVAALLDYLDGRVARLTNSTSELGAQLDSFADLVSFGIAPAAICYAFALSNGLYPWPFLLGGFIFVVGCTVRLAHFNLGSGTSTNYSGVPSPIAANFLTAFVWLIADSDINPAWVYFIPAWCFVLAILMVSKFTFSKLSSLRASSQNNNHYSSLWTMMVIACSMALLTYNPALALFTASCCYIGVGLLTTSMRFVSIYIARRKILRKHSSH